LKAIHNIFICPHDETNRLFIVITCTLGTNIEIEWPIITEIANVKLTRNRKCAKQNCTLDRTKLNWTQIFLNFLFSKKNFGSNIDWLQIKMTWLKSNLKWMICFRGLIVDIAYIAYFLIVHGKQKSQSSRSYITMHFTTKYSRQLFYITEDWWEARSVFDLCSWQGRFSKRRMNQTISLKSSVSLKPINEKLYLLSWENHEWRNERRSWNILIIVKSFPCPSYTHLATIYPEKVITNLPPLKH